jgi:hypothetical protein
MYACVYARVGGKAFRVWAIERNGELRAPVGFSDVIEDETTDLSFNIARLVADWNLYNTKQGARIAPRTDNINRGRDRPW